MTMLFDEDNNLHGLLSFFPPVQKKMAAQGRRYTFPMPEATGAILTFAVCFADIFPPETGTLLSLRDISPNRGITFQGRQVLPPSAAKGRNYLPHGESKNKRGSNNLFQERKTKI